MPADRRQPLPVTVIGGYLGAGKTTLLNALLSDPGGRRIGVIVNDFGELGVDASLISSLADGATPVVNLANGCVCCTLGDDLGTTLMTMAGIEPALDHVVIEASGVADPKSVAAWGTVDPFVPGGTIVLAAADGDGVQRMSRDRYVGGEVLRQLVGADLVLLTKSDLVDDDEAECVRQWLTEIAGVPVIDAAWGAIDSDIVLGAPLRHANDRRQAALGSADDRYERWTWRQRGTVTRRSLDSFLAELPPGLLRLKGVLEVSDADDTATVLVQLVGSKVSMNPVEGIGLLGIEAIGIRGVFDIVQIDRCVLKYLQPG